MAPCAAWVSDSVRCVGKEMKWNSVHHKSSLLGIQKHSISLSRALFACH